MGSLLSANTHHGSAQLKERATSDRRDGTVPDCCHEPHGRTTAESTSVSHPGDAKFVPATIGEHHQVHVDLKRDDISDL
jgi:hypothetical protein